MEFWGVEVKAGEPLKVAPEPGYVIHVSQAALGEPKNKGNESAHLFVKVDNKKLVLGTLSLEKFPQLTFDLVFEKEFELSHNWRNGSVSLTGYKTAIPDEGFTDFSSDEDEEEDFPIIDVENGGVQPKSENAKPADKKAKIVEPSKPKKAEEDDSGDDDESDSEGDESDSEGDSEEGGSEEGDDSDDDDSETDSEDQETPNKAFPSGKKRANESATKTPVPAKKAKQSSPQKSDGKKNVHIATPHPAKQAGKAANAKNANQQTPKSGGQFSCKPCGKSFGSDSALQSHTKAKHAGK